MKNLVQKHHPECTANGRKQNHKPEETKPYMKHKTITVSTSVFLHTKEYRKNHHLSESELLQKVLDERTKLRQLAAKITILPQTVRRYMNNKLICNFKGCNTERSMWTDFCDEHQRELYP